MRKLVYADNAATTKLSEKAFEAMKPFLLQEYGNASQPYSFARTPKKALKWARETIAECIGAEPDEIYFTSCGTESDNWVIKGYATANHDRKTTITSAFEHQAILRACRAIERLGYPVIYLLPTKDGYIDVKTLEETIEEKTGLVSIMLANNELGTIQPIKQLCEIAHKHGAYFHTDAVQAVGHLALDVHDLGVDFLSASGHKFNGPKGVGFLYIRKGVSLPSYLDGGAQERALRAGTENVAAIVAMATALEENTVEMEINQSRLKALEGKLLHGMDDLKIRYVRNGGKQTLPGIISLSLPGYEGEALLHRLDLWGISISTGSACESQSTEISQVLKAIQLPDDYAKGTIRISLGKYNTEEEVEYILHMMGEIIQ